MYLEIDCPKCGADLLFESEEKIEGPALGLHCPCGHKLYLVLDRRKQLDDEREKTLSRFKSISDGEPYSSYERNPELADAVKNLDFSNYKRSAVSFDLD